VDGNVTVDAGKVTVDGGKVTDRRVIVTGCVTVDGNVTVDAGKVTVDGGKVTVTTAAFKVVNALCLALAVTVTVTTLGPRVVRLRVDKLLVVDFVRPDVVRFNVVLVVVLLVDLRVVLLVVLLVDLRVDLVVDLEVVASATVQTMERTNQRQIQDASFKRFLGIFCSLGNRLGIAKKQSRRIPRWNNE